VKTVEHEGKLVKYIEATLDDIAVANRLAHQVLGRSLDELAPQTRRMLTLLDGHVGASCERQAISRKDFRFSRREAREATGFGATQTRVHLERLIELEYVLVHRGANGTSYVHELAYEGKADAGGPRLPGLVDVEALSGTSTTPTLRGPQGGLAGSLRPPGGRLASTLRGGDEAGSERGEAPKKRVCGAPREQPVVRAASGVMARRGERKPERRIGDLADAEGMGRAVADHIG
jgi:DNA primase